MKPHIPGITFVKARSEEAYTQAAALFRAYAGELGIDLEFQDFTNELKHLQTQYSPPQGAIILALNAKKVPVGCVAVRKFEKNICELKRMYVSSAARGMGIGKLLLKKAIETGRETGYSAMRLDTLPGMHTAIQLYEKEGFYPIAPYRYNPVPGTRYYEKQLKKMTEKEKMLSGLLYDAGDPELAAERHRARLLCQKINNMNEAKKEARVALLYELLGKAGEGLWIEPPFYCDYGSHITVGEKVFMNFNCCILDVMEVRLGDRALLGPNVQIYTATHPMDAATRASGLEYAKPVYIGNDVWIGGGAVICPGVTLGDRVVVGAGAVVTKDVPADVFVAGNPARLIKKLDNSGYK